MLSVSDFALAASTALLTAVGSYFLWVWRQRARPWMTIVGVFDATAGDETVHVDAELAELTRRIHFGSRFISEGTSLGTIRAHYRRLSEFVEEAGASSSAVDASLARLRAASSPGDVIGTVQDLLLDQPLRSVLGGELYRGSIKPPRFDPGVEKLIDWIYSSNVDGGSVLVNFPEYAIRLASGVEDEPLRRASHEALAELISRAERDKLLSVFEAARHAERQEEELGRKALPMMKALVDSNSTWTARISLTNFGSSPFLLLPEAACLVVSGPGVSVTRLPAQLLREDDDGAWVTNPDSTVAVTSGSTIELGLATITKQVYTPNGKVLRGLFEQGNGVIWAELRVVNAGWERPQVRKTRNAPFRARPKSPALT